MNLMKIWYMTGAEVARATRARGAGVGGGDKGGAGEAGRRKMAGVGRDRTTMSQKEEE